MQPMIIALLGYHVNEAFCCTQRLVRNENLREVSVSSYFRAENYAVAKAILVNKYCTKAS